MRQCRTQQRVSFVGVGVDSESVEYDLNAGANTLYVGNDDRQSHLLSRRPRALGERHLSPYKPRFTRLQSHSRIPLKLLIWGYGDPRRIGLKQLVPVMWRRGGAGRHV